jgi:hypothetical protein
MLFSEKHPYRKLPIKLRLFSDASRIPDVTNGLVLLALGLISMCHTRACASQLALNAFSERRSPNAPSGCFRAYSKWLFDLWGHCDQPLPAQLVNPSSASSEAWLLHSG